MSKDFIFKLVQGTGRVLYAAKNEEINGIVPYQKIFMSLQHVGHKLVICGSHPDCCVGQWVKWVNTEQV